MTPIEFAERLIKEFGYIVVWYKTPKPIGSKQTMLWSTVKSPTPLTIVREATTEEAQKIKQIYLQETGRKWPENSFHFPYSYVLITD